MTLAAMPVQIALVDESGTIDAAQLSEVAGALNEQVNRDFAPIWRTRASVVPFMGAKVNPGTWAVYLQNGLDEPSAAGYHADDNHQPYARVDLKAGDWTVTASHEILEMLGDPWGSRMHTAQALEGFPGDSRRVLYLVEMCDPCEAFSYEVGGVPMSDFLVPWYYNTTSRRHTGFSFLGELDKPRQVADGGYISLMDPADGHWWQLFVSHGQSGWHDLGRFDAQSDWYTPRAFTDAHSRLLRSS
jgi:hypothetical protein